MLTLKCDNELMRTPRLAFAFFAAAILFSIVREWAVPVACMRPIPEQVAPISSSR